MMSAAFSDLANTAHSREEDAIEAGFSYANRLAYRLTFTDSRGVRWTRDEHGVLGVTAGTTE